MLDATSGFTDRCFVTDGGIDVRRRTTPLSAAEAIAPLLPLLDHRRGALFSSGVEMPGRYTRWDVGFVDPPIALTARQDSVEIAALNERGLILLPAMAAALDGLPALAALTRCGDRLKTRVRAHDAGFPEEARSRQPSVFAVLRAILAAFRCTADPHLGLYGAFGYDLAFQFEQIALRLARAADQRDFVLYLPDRITVVDHQRATAFRHDYEFTVAGHATDGLPRDGADSPFLPGNADTTATSDHAPGEYQAVVRAAREAFARGDLFEVVPGQTFATPTAGPPSRVFSTLARINPAPYAVLINLGAGEFLVSASPEMYVRVDGRRVETAPISGTIARGADAIGDARQILALLNSEKETAELTMCTDVDRNDKARICEPGSVRVIGRRQIELHSRLIHTVDHVEGRLRDGYDALDAFLTHAWAVTVTGAPKRWAMQFIEDHERTARRWYGGAIGWIGFDGGLNTGLTLRTARLANGMAEVRAGATLLFDSDPDAENAECELKASALLAAIEGGRAASPPPPPPSAEAAMPGAGKRVLLVDHEDSFVHTLADYFRQTGADVTTLRAPLGRTALRPGAFDLVVLSPGPGRPKDFDLSGTLGAALAAELPVFGVCLGLQGMVEYCGGRLGRINPPRHGKPSRIEITGGRYFADLATPFVAGRYHSLHAERASLPPELVVTAVSDDGIVMGVEHAWLPMAAVQFHPESILTLDGGAGLALIRHMMRMLTQETVA